MDTRFLETLIAVVDHGSLAEAARLQRLTPATAAQRIRVLEAEVGHKLIQRSGRMVKPTAAALAIMTQARSILRDANELKSLASNQRLTGQLRIGAVATAMTGIIPDLLEGIVGMAPELDYFVQPGFTGELYSLMLEGNLDIAIIVQPTFELASSCDMEPLREEELIAIASENHIGSDPLELLRREPFIHGTRHRWMGAHAEAYLLARSIRPKLRFEMNAVDSIMLLVARNLGIALIPDWPPPWPEQAKLVRLRLPDPPKRKIVLAWSRNPSRTHLIDVVRRSAARLPNHIRNIA